MNFIARFFIALFFSISYCHACPTYDVIFHDMVCIKPYQNYRYQTCKPFTVTIDHFILKVPEDFDTDLASIPQWLWMFIAPGRSDFIAPAILHDYLYSCHSGFTRKEVDNVFLNALIRNGVSKFRAYQMYYTVRLFGGDHYDLKQTC